MTELFKHFLNKPLDQYLIKRVAFQYFNNDLKQARIFLEDITTKKNHTHTQKDLF